MSELTYMKNYITSYCNTIELYEGGIVFVVDVQLFFFKLREKI